LEKKEVSGDQMHDAQNNPTQTTDAIKVACFMEGRSNITVELTGRRATEQLRRITFDAKVASRRSGSTSLL
jgi:hypothetical protein